MPELGGDFDARRYEPEQPFEVLPAGKYLAQISNSDLRTTKDGAGTYIWLELDILDGPHAGRKIWDRINQQNPKQQAVDIGQRRLSALCHAIGKLVISRTEELLGTPPVIVTVQVRPAEGQYPESNAIRGYAPAQGGQKVAQRAPVVPGEPEAKVMPANAPWKRAQR